MNSISILALYIFFSFSGSQSAGDKMEICREGCFHANEVKFDFSKPWFGIFRMGTSDDYEIRKVHPYVMKCSDPIFDTETDTLTGREVMVEKDYGGALLLIGGIDLKGGGMEVAHIHDPRCLYPGDYIRLKLNDQDYTLMAAGSIEFDTSNHRIIPYIRNYKVMLIQNMDDHAEVQDIIFFDRLYASEEVQPAVFFAGDIDRDGGLDLIYNLSDHYNMSNLTLFLSSAAADGQLVKQVANWKTTGC